MKHTSAPDFYNGALSGESEEDFASRCAANLEALILDEGPDTVAALFVEPVMGAGGVIIPPRTYFTKIRAVLEKYDILLVADEVICGFGRTGNMWESQTMDVRPDMLTWLKPFHLLIYRFQRLCFQKKYMRHLDRPNSWESSVTVTPAQRILFAPPSRFVHSN